MFDIQHNPVAFSKWLKEMTLVAYSMTPENYAKLRLALDVGRSCIGREDLVQLRMDAYAARDTYIIANPDEWKRVEEEDESNS